VTDSRRSTAGGSEGRPPGLAAALDSLRPMLAVPGTLPASDDGWAYEMKWDGRRALVFVEDDGVRVVSRTGRDISHAYPELAELAAAPGLAAAGVGQAVLDGEIVAFGGGDWPDFEALQQRMNISTAAQARLLAAQIPVTYLAFDLLWLNGERLTDLPYSRRRELLDSLDLNGRHWQTPPAFTGESGADVQAVSRQHGLEGIMAKRVASRYEPGRRAASWRKIKNLHRQEVVIGGWKPGEGARSGRIGSLLVGVHDAGQFVYCGHVGTGFTQQTLSMLGKKLMPLRRDASPFAGEVPTEDARSARWVDPVLVAEVEFADWTRSGRLRAPSYKGLRDDKDAADVIREP
jgi:bifunctional non-homologous end joining protein LigD